MGSYTGNITCPNCSRENCQREYYYRTDEVFITCFDCGFRHVRNVKTDDNYDYCLKDETRGPTRDNLVYEEYTIENPYGCCSIMYKNGCGSLLFLQDEDEFTELMKQVDGEEDVVQIT